ncbi:hypothetical protein QE361_002732 [Sphingomonas sp. SORGH_AS802]|uniref:hypothetical protein n=1 Tax=Sphingomonas sp. SORGH_AS_0802 TaxID=3041800 RepID=UPI002866B4F5|nr:hypothetical protein [Sphingomonas sp. SORGH_AS_0802]MDR6135737.1 hypothetical protein [Sphingomonas sp. SORGH_AS_0802]
MHLFITETVIVRLDDDGGATWAKAFNHAHFADCQRPDGVLFIQSAAGAVDDDLSRSRMKMEPLIEGI